MELHIQTANVVDRIIAIRDPRELWRAEEAVPINFRWDLIRTYLRDLAE